MRRVQLVAPTSTDERIALAGRQTDGWLYLVTLTGTTGARGELSPALAGLVERTRRLVDVPLYAGFGISTPEHARAAVELADGIAVGSRAVQVAEEGPAALREYVASLRAALDAVPCVGYAPEELSGGVSGGIAGAGSTRRGTAGTTGATAAGGSSSAPAPAPARAAGCGDEGRHGERLRSDASTARERYGLRGGRSRERRRGRDSAGSNDTGDTSAGAAGSRQRAEPPQPAQAQRVRAERARARTGAGADGRRARRARPRTGAEAGAGATGACAAGRPASLWASWA